MESIGFSLYMELLENAVDALKEGREPSLEDLTSQQTEVELRMPSLLPDDYIPDVNTRLSFYKRIASAKGENELEEIKVELIDRLACCPIRLVRCWISPVYASRRRNWGSESSKAMKKAVPLNLPRKTTSTRSG